MKTITLDIGPEDEGRTIQAILHDRAGFTHGQARGVIDAGAVRRLSPGPGTGIPPGRYAHRVRAGERYAAAVDASRRYRPAPPLPAGPEHSVLYQDRDLLVVNKKAHVLTVPTALREDEESLVEILLEGERRRGVRHPALFALHRLDRDTSGLLLFARARETFERLQEQFVDRSIERRYLAVATGRLASDRGTFKSRLVEEKRSLKVHSTTRPGAGREAVTEYEVIERLPQATVLDVKLRTGRKNQIRVHLAEAGHPLVGDRKYGAASPLIGRTALHARTLSFVHPATGRTVRFDAPPPNDLKRLIRSLRGGEAPEKIGRKRRKEG